MPSLALSGQNRFIGCFPGLKPWAYRRGHGEKPVAALGGPGGSGCSSSGTGSHGGPSGNGGSSSSTGSHGGRGGNGGSSSSTCSTGSQGGRVGTADLLAPPVVTVTVLVIAHLQPQQTEKVTLPPLPEKVMSERVALRPLPPLPEKGLMEKVTVLALPEKGITETKEINVHLRHPSVRWHPLVRWLP
jgi:hypothetical protein